MWVSFGGDISVQEMVQRHSHSETFSHFLIIFNTCTLCHDMSYCIILESHGSRKLRGLAPPILSSPPAKIFLTSPAFCVPIFRRKMGGDQRQGGTPPMECPSPCVLPSACAPYCLLGARTKHFFIQAFNIFPVFWL